MVLEDEQFAPECVQIVRPFEQYIFRGRPYVTAKWAMTLDGKLATHAGDSHWISGPAARLWVHDLRDRVDAILVGANTARIDNPQLTVRIPPEKRVWQRTEREYAPWRVVLSTQGALPDTLALLQPELAARTCVLVSATGSTEQCQQLADHGVEVIPVAANEKGQVDFLAALQALAHKGIMHVLVEGGASVLGSAFDQRGIDHVAAFIAPKLLGGHHAPSPVAGEGLATMVQAQRLNNIQTHIFGEDILIEGDVPHTP